MTVVCKKLHNNELRNLYSSQSMTSNKSARLRWAGHVECMGDVKYEYKIWLERLEGKNHMKDYRCRREDNIAVYLG